MPEENVEKALELVDRFNERDVEAIQALFTRDVEIVPTRAALEGTRYSGPTAAAQWLAAVDEAWMSITVEMDEARDLGDRVLGLGRIHGRGRASGARIDVESAALVEFRDGLIARFRIYTDVRAALADAELES
jgi:ketosteroid isomerase-like protein